MEVVGGDRLWSPWRKEKVVVVMVERREGKIGRDGVLPCQTENRAHRARYRPDVDAVCASSLCGLLGEEDTVVVVGHQEREIGRGQAFTLPNRKPSAMALGIGRV
jgi:hypothetical protein